MESHDGRDFVNALLLALIAGCVDGVGFLQLGGFFVSFMSGNSTRLGIGLGSGFWREAGLAAGLIAMFVGGVAAGSLIGQRAGARRRLVLFVTEAVLLGAAAACHRFGHPGGATVPMVLAMGIANSLFGRDGEARFGFAYMTGALVQVGHRLAGGAGAGQGGWKPYAAIWLALVMGAVLSARMYPSVGGQILWAPALLLLAMAVWPTRREPRPSVWETEQN